MTSTSRTLFDHGFLQQLAQRAQVDDFVARHRTLADLRIGFRHSETGQAGWIAVTPQAINAGLDGPAPFTFVGDASAMQDLANGFPFNRLVRQHRLSVEGDLRACVQNWLLIHAILALCVKRSD